MLGQNVVLVQWLVLVAAGKRWLQHWHDCYTM